LFSICRAVFIADQRFLAIKQPDKYWTLQIKYVQARDAGSYECQVSTEPKVSARVQLQVVGKSGPRPRPWTWNAWAYEYEFALRHSPPNELERVISGRQRAKVKRQQMRKLSSTLTKGRATHGPASLHLSCGYCISNYSLNCIQIAAADHCPLNCSKTQKKRRRAHTCTNRRKISLVGQVF